MASTAQASAHLLQVLQVALTPKSIGLSGLSGRSVYTLQRRTLGPYLGVMRSPFLPSSPRPASTARGTLSPVALPAGTAVYPRFLMNAARVDAVKASLLYPMPVAAAAGSSGLVAMARSVISPAPLPPAVSSPAASTGYLSLYHLSPMRLGPPGRLRRSQLNASAQASWTV